MLIKQDHPFRTAAVALIAIIAVIYLSFAWSRRAGILNLQAGAQSRISAFSTELFAPTDKYSYLPEFLSDHPVITNALKHAQDPRHARAANRLLERLNTASQSAAIYVLNPQGTVIAGSNWREPQSFVGQNYSFRPYFQDALREGAGRFYGMGTTSLTPGYYLSQRIKEGDAVLGVAVVKVDMHKLDESWSTNRDEMTVTDENGVIFLSSLKDWKYRPTHALSAATQDRLKQTRQYGAVLKAPLRWSMVEEPGQDEKIVEVVQVSENRREEKVLYFVKSKKLAGSEWTISIFTPMEAVIAKSRRIAAISAGMLAFVALCLMYLQQVRSRMQERAKAQAALEQAHEALEQKHRELQAVSAELRLASITDPLTGTYNRRFFRESLEKMTSFARRHRQPLSIILIDADHFKRINDVHGHLAGDKVLRTLAAICKENLRDTDVLARYGGEEFIMALPNTDEQAAKAVAERLRMRVLDQAIEADGASLRVAISAGVSQHRFEESGFEETVKRADQALYVAKNNGRNQVVTA